MKGNAGGFEPARDLTTASLASNTSSGVDSLDVEPTNLALQRLALEVELLEVESVGYIENEQDGDTEQEGSKAAHTLTLEDATGKYGTNSAADTATAGLWFFTHRTGGCGRLLGYGLGRVHSFR